MFVENVSPPATLNTCEVKYRDAVSAPTQGPPNGHPDAFARSTPNRRRSDSFNVYTNLSVQSGERKSRNCFSSPFTPYIGVISPPPNPASLYDSNDAVSPFSVTALPCHHQRVHGLISGVISGQTISPVSFSCKLFCSQLRNKAIRQTERKVKHFMVIGVALFIRTVYNINL